MSMKIGDVINFKMFRVNMENKINIVELPKYFKIYNSVSQDLWFDNPFVEVKNKQEL